MAKTATFTRRTRVTRSPSRRFPASRERPRRNRDSNGVDRQQHRLGVQWVLVCSLEHNERPGDVRQRRQHFYSTDRNGATYSSVSLSPGNTVLAYTGTQGDGVTSTWGDGDANSTGEIF